MKKTNKTSLALAIGGSFVSGLTATAVQADTLSDTQSNPFSFTELATGYMQTAASDTDKMKDGSCGEGKCGGDMAKGSEEKTSEGKCAGNKPMPKMDAKDKNTEGKCGEGKCGGNM